MTISYYIHAWQGLLMFFAGLVSIAASLGGYIQSGGGEELLRRSLAQFSQGKAHFDSIDFHWSTGEMNVRNLRYDDFAWPKDRPIANISDVQADDLIVRLDLFPWPPIVDSVKVVGAKNLKVKLNEGFLQDAKFAPQDTPDLSGAAKHWQMADVSLTCQVGETTPLKLEGCSGELRRDNNGNLRGEISLSKLDGKPFQLKLETLEDGRWVLSGDQIELATGKDLPKIKPFPDKLDPVSLLVKALFSGEMGAEGTVSSLHITLTPASGSSEFSCDGEVAYANLNLNLPPPDKASGEVLPFFLDVFLGANEQAGSLWPRWMQVDSIRSGKHGRVAFHMAERKLDFACDEGAEGAFVGFRQRQAFPPLEALKGSVETDADGRPARVVLRGFLGDQLSFETQMARHADNSRTYQLHLEPRAGDATRVAFDAPLWRVVSRVTDYFSVLNRGPLPLAEIEVEANAEQFPAPEWLPPGLTGISGRLYAKGRLDTDQAAKEEALVLKLDEVKLDDFSARVEPRAPNAPSGPPVCEALRLLLAEKVPGTLDHVYTHGSVSANFTLPFHWDRTELGVWKVDSGSVKGENSASDLAGSTFSASHKTDNGVAECVVDVFPVYYSIKLNFSARVEPQPNGSNKGQVELKRVWPIDAARNMFWRERVFFDGENLRKEIDTPKL